MRIEGVLRSTRRNGRGKEAGPALNPLKGSSAFLPSDGPIHRTIKTKVKVLKRNVVD